MLVLGSLIQELEKYKAPVLKEVRAAMNEKRALRALFGKYRESTIRRYLTYCEHVRRWVASMGKVDCPIKPVDFVDYLYAREEEGMGPSIPLAVYQAVLWFEAVAGP